MTADYPLDERGWIAAATAHYFTGQQDRALDTCRRARTLLVEELGVDPTAALALVEQQILDHTVPDRSPSTPSAPTAEALPPPLPPVPEPFVGRAELIEETLGRYAAGARLVTLVGIGGIGKTSTALAVAHRLAVDHLVRFCTAETDADVPAVLARLCQVLGVDAGDDPEQALAAAGPTGFVVVDNVEHIDGIGPVLARLLTNTAALSLLVTSRRPIGVRAEHLIRVTGLALPAAEQLFRSRADQVRPGIGAAQPEQIRALCVLLDGVPLAVELAVGRIGTLTPKQILARIQTRRASILDGADGVVVPERQASLRLVLQYSYDTLTEGGQRLVQLLGSFEGWVSLEFLEEAAIGWVDDMVEALDAVARAGLVTLDDSGRMRMLVPVREFAAGLGPRTASNTRLLETARRLAARNGPRLFGADVGTALDELRRDDDVLVTALGMLAELHNGDLAVAFVLDLSRYWLVTGRFVDGRRWIDRVAADPGLSPSAAAQVAMLAGTFASYLNDPRTADLLGGALASADDLDLPIDRLRVNGWCCLAAFAAQHRDLSRADAAADRAAELAATSGNPALAALARDIRGFVAAHSGDHDRALAAALDGLVDARRAQETFDVVALLNMVAEALLYLDRSDEALIFADEAFDLAGTADVGGLLGPVLLTRGMVLVASGRTAAARGCLVEAVRYLRDGRPDPLGIADLLFVLGAALGAELRDVEASRCFGAAEALYRDEPGAGAQRTPAPFRALRDTVRDRLGEQSFATIAALGAADPDRVVTLLLETSVELAVG